MRAGVRVHKGQSEQPKHARLVHILSAECVHTWNVRKQAVIWPGLQRSMIKWPRDLFEATAVSLYLLHARCQDVYLGCHNDGFAYWHTAQQLSGGLACKHLASASESWFSPNHACQRRHMSFHWAESRAGRSRRIETAHRGLTSPQFDR